MPINEYNCPKCSAQFEVLVRTKSDVPTVCPSCGKGKPVKAFSAFATLTRTSSMPSCASSCASAGDSCLSSPCGGGCCGMGN